MLFGVLSDLHKPLNSGRPLFSAHRPLRIAGTDPALFLSFLRAAEGISNKIVTKVLKHGKAHLKVK